MGESIDHDLYLEEPVGLKVDEASFYKLQWLIAIQEKSRLQIIVANNRLTEVRADAQRKIANAEAELNHARIENKEIGQKYKIIIKQIEEEIGKRLKDPDFKLMHWILKEDMTLIPSPVHPINQKTADKIIAEEFE